MATKSLQKMLGLLQGMPSWKSNDPHAYASTEWIAKTMKLSERQVGRLRKEARSQGLLDWVRHGSLVKTNLYVPGSGKVSGGRPVPVKRKCPGIQTQLQLQTKQHKEVRDQKPPGGNADAFYKQAKHEARSRKDLHSETGWVRWRTRQLLSKAQEKDERREVDERRRSCGKCGGTGFERVNEDTLRMCGCRKETFVPGPEEESPPIEAYFEAGSGKQERATMPTKSVALRTSVAPSTPKKRWMFEPAKAREAALAEGHSVATVDAVFAEMRRKQSSLNEGSEQDPHVMFREIITRLGAEKVLADRRGSAMRKQAEEAIDRAKKQESTNPYAVSGVRFGAMAKALKAGQPVPVFGGDAKPHRGPAPLASHMRSQDDDPEKPEPMTPAEAEAVFPGTPLGQECKRNELSLALLSQLTKYDPVRLARVALWQTRPEGELFKRLRDCLTDEGVMRAIHATRDLYPDLNPPPDYG